METVQQTVKMDIIGDFNENKVIPLDQGTVERDEKLKTFDVQRTCLKHILLLMKIIGCHNNSKNSENRPCGNILFSLHRLFICLVLLTFMVKTASGYPYITKSDYFGHLLYLLGQYVT